MWSAKATYPLWSPGPGHLALWRRLLLCGPPRLLWRIESYWLDGLLKRAAMILDYGYGCARFYSATIWIAFPSIPPNTPPQPHPTPTHPMHFEPVPAPGCNWRPAGAGRLMPRRKDNRHSTNHISNTGPTPRTASRNNSSLADGSGRLWFKHLHGWNTCTALQIHGMQQVSGVNVYYTLERETTGPEWNGVCLPVIIKEHVSWMSNEYVTPIHCTENILNTYKHPNVPNISHQGVVI